MVATARRSTDMNESVRRTTVDQLVDWDKLEPHALANLMPMMGDEEFAGLQADILKNGLQIPIQLHEGKILDGRNRYRALKALVAEDKLAFNSSMFVQYRSEERRVGKE